MKKIVTILALFLCIAQVQAASLAVRITAYLWTNGVEDVQFFGPGATVGIDSLNRIRQWDVPGVPEPLISDLPTSAESRAILEDKRRIIKPKQVRKTENRYIELCREWYPTNAIQPTPYDPDDLLDLLDDIGSTNEDLSLKATKKARNNMRKLERTWVKHGYNAVNEYGNLPQELNDEN